MAKTKGTNWTVIISIVICVFSALQLYTYNLWKDRAEILKENISIMKTYADKMKDDKSKLDDKLKQYAPSDISVKEISLDFDKNYKKVDDVFYNAIPVSCKIKPQQSKEQNRGNK